MRRREKELIDLSISQSHRPCGPSVSKSLRPYRPSIPFYPQFVPDLE